jgi:hypothetical protein
MQSLHYNPINHPPPRLCFSATARAATASDPYHHHRRPPVTARRRPAIMDDDYEDKRFQIFFSGGAISRVRLDFVFPKMTLCTLITCWFCGNESAKTVPFKLLRPMEIKKVSERHKWSKMNFLMMGVQLAAERCDMWRPQRGT